jgi:phosphoglycerate dehydrogenase-like enzyme
MELIYCDLDININMYNVPKVYRKELSEKFKECSFIYESEVNNKNLWDVKIYWGNRLPKDFLKIFPNLKWIHFGSVGIDRFQKINNPEKEKITVTNSQNSVTKGMYAHTLFQIFFLLRQGYLINRMRSLNSLSRENYDMNYKKILNVNDLKVLIVGYGNIGSQLGSTLKQMGAKVTGIAFKERKSKDGTKIYEL